MLRQISRRIFLYNRNSISRTLSTPVSNPEGNSENAAEDQSKNISKAMRAYLERAREHDQFMHEEKQKYQIGKRHLANMMGENPETFTQEDVDEAIAYLFPSGLFEKKARPIMKPPEEVFPQRKAAEFDEKGRPHHFLFYTASPNYYKLLYDIVENIIECNKIEDAMMKKQKEPDPNLAISSSGYNWLDKEGLEKVLIENITERQYNNFVISMERLFSLPYSFKMREFIEKYRKPLMSQTTSFEIPKPEYDSEGRAFVTTYECRRKDATGYVTVRKPGTGRVTVNGQDLRYFTDFYCNEQILFPLIFTDLHKSVDVEAHVEKGGPSGQAGAIRWGIAWSLRSFVDQEMVEKMRIAGLLTKDVRTRERKKPGRKGARKKYTWKKR